MRALVLKESSSPLMLEDVAPPQPGPTEVLYIEGATVTLLQYLMEPITSVLRRAGREI